jgi:hypothetical protein
MDSQPLPQLVWRALLAVLGLLRGALFAWTLPLTQLLFSK